MGANDSAIYVINICELLSNIRHDNLAFVSVLMHVDGTTNIRKARGRKGLQETITVNKTGKVTVWKILLLGKAGRKAGSVARMPSNIEVPCPQETKGDGMVEEKHGSFTHIWLISQLMCNPGIVVVPLQHNLKVWCFYTPLNKWAEVMGQVVKWERYKDTWWKGIYWCFIITNAKMIK